MGVTVMFLLVGGVFIAFGAHGLVVTRRFRKTAQRAPGVVVDVRYVSSQHSDGLYYPVLRFVTAQGQQVTTPTEDGRRPPAARTGQSVTVLYDPKDPQRANVDNRWGAGCMSVVLVVVGAVTVLLGLLLRGFAGT